MNKQRLSLIFLILMIVGIVSSYLLFLQLRGAYDSLEIMRYELEAHQKNSEKKEQEQEVIIDSLFVVIDSLISRFSIEDKSLVEQKTSLENKARHVNYYVGLHGLVSDRSSFDQTLNYLHSEGYTVIGDQIHNSSPDWMASSSTVFYYDSSTRPQAKILAEDIGRLTQSNFQFTQGAGLGVPKDKKDQYFYIHLIKN